IVGPRSLRLDTCELHDLAPLLGFLGDERREVGRRAGNHGAAKIGNSLAHLRVGESRLDLVVEPVDDLRGRGPWCSDPKPSARLEARQDITYDRDIRQYVRACRRRYRQGSQLASPDMFN